MFIEKVSEVTEELQEALQRLIPQLGVHKSYPTLEELDELIKSESTALLVARYPDEDGALAGILSQNPFIRWWGSSVRPGSHL